MKKVKRKVKLKDHDHSTGKYQGDAHQECCNLNLSLRKKNLFCFIICKTDSHLIFQQVGKYNLPKM